MARRDACFSRPQDQDDRTGELLRRPSKEGSYALSACGVGRHGDHRRRCRRNRALGLLCRLVRPLPLDDPHRRATCRPRIPGSAGERRSVSRPGPTLWNHEHSLLCDDRQRQGSGPRGRTDEHRPLGTTLQPGPCRGPQPQYHAGNASAAPTAPVHPAGTCGAGRGNGR